MRSSAYFLTNRLAIWKWRSKQNRSAMKRRMINWILICLIGFTSCRIKLRSLKRILYGRSKTAMLCWTIESLLNSSKAQRKKWKQNFYLKLKGAFFIIFLDEEASQRRIFWFAKASSGKQWLVEQFQWIIWAEDKIFKQIRWLVRAVMRNEVLP